MKTKKELAEEKINNLRLSETQKEIALYDWTEGEEHWNWILSASYGEIIDWIKSFPEQE